MGPPRRKHLHQEQGCPPGGATPGRKRPQAGVKLVFRGLARYSPIPRFQRIAERFFGLVQDGWQKLVTNGQRVQGLNWGRRPAHSK